MCVCVVNLFSVVLNDRVCFTTEPTVVAAETIVAMFNSITEVYDILN